MERKSHIPGYTGFIRNGQVGRAWLWPEQHRVSSLVRLYAIPRALSCYFRLPPPSHPFNPHPPSSSPCMAVVFWVQAVAGRSYGRASERALNSSIEKLVVGDMIPSDPHTSTKVPVCGRCGVCTCCGAGPAARAW